MGDGWALFFELSLVYGSAMAFGFYQLYSLRSARRKLDARLAADASPANRPEQR